MPISVSKCAGVGAVVGGLDLSQPLSEDEFAGLREAFAENGLLFFENQSLSETDHIAFAKLWGEIDINRFFGRLEGHPEIAEVRKEPGEAHNIGGGWHTDHSYDAEPAMGSILVARTLPPSGGDTLFASMYAAYDGLSDGLKKTLDGLRARHSCRHIYGSSGFYRSMELGGRVSGMEQADAMEDVVHPLVITHPLSGKKALFVNPAFTLGVEDWSDDEAKPFLQMLFAHAMKPDYQYRHVWKPGSVAFWDNRATWHFAQNDYAGERRLMHRITVKGGPLH